MARTKLTRIASMRWYAGFVCDTQPGERWRTRQRAGGHDSGLAVLLSSACMVVAFFIARRFSRPARIESVPAAA